MRVWPRFFVGEETQTSYHLLKVHLARGPSVLPAQAGLVSWEATLVTSNPSPIWIPGLRGSVTQTRFQPSNERESLKLMSMSPIALLSKSLLMVVALMTCLSGCITAIGPLHQIDTEVRPNDAERDLMSAFLGYGIPLVERNLDGRVRSGQFLPLQVWGDLAKERVICGASEETDPQMREEPDVIEIVATIRTRTQAGTRVDLDSSGWSESREGKRTRCRLTKRFSEEILAQVGSGRRW